MSWVVDVAVDVVVDVVEDIVEDRVVEDEDEDEDDIVREKDPPTLWTEVAFEDVVGQPEEVVGGRLKVIMLDVAGMTDTVSENAPPKLMVEGAIEETVDGLEIGLGGRTRDTEFDFVTIGELAGVPAESDIDGFEVVDVAGVGRIEGLAIIMLGAEMVVGTTIDGGEGLPIETILLGAEAVVGTTMTGGGEYIEVDKTTVVEGPTWHSYMFNIFEPPHSCSVSPLQGMLQSPGGAEPLGEL